MKFTGVLTLVAIVWRMKTSRESLAGECSEYGVNDYYERLPCSTNKGLIISYFYC